MDAKRNQIYSLGILLLELAFNAPLHSLRDVEEVENSGSLSADSIDIVTATRLARRDLVYEMGTEYANVVLRLLNRFKDEQCDHNDNRFYEVMWQGVIEPLERDFRLRAPPDWKP